MHDTAMLEAHWGGGAAPFGATWQKTMMWGFIVTDALLFSGLLCGYAFLRDASTMPWPKQSEVFSIPFIALTGFHGSHVFSGLVILIITAIRTALGRTPPQGIEMAGLYWHFVDLV